jgi:multidrug efflux system membrane fusion protein
MQIDPITVIFTLPQQRLEAVLSAMTKGNKPAVVILDGTGQTALAKGWLLTIDNQVDTATGTFRLKAIVPNDANRLWPGQFVRARLLVDTLKGVTTVPENALQRGPVRLWQAGWC